MSILAVAGPGFSMVLYDDFSGNTLDKMKWEHVEFVREIDAVSQKLRLQTCQSESYFHFGISLFQLKRFIIF